MSKNVEIILEGSYLYYEKEVNYSQENFKLVQDADSQTYQIYSEILSRIETGEFLKILVKYEMNYHFLPTFVRIERSIGNKYAEEVYTIDQTELLLHYTFRNSNTTQEFQRSISAKHHISTPAVCTSAIFTLSKKFDATGRTPVIIIGSDNDWTYRGPPSEKIIYADYLMREMNDFQLNGNSLSASHLGLYENDASHATGESPVELFLSKHYSVPYKLLHEDQKIVIKKLKRNN
jgi:hypothetical protein